MGFEIIPVNVHGLQKKFAKKLCWYVMNFEKIR